MKLGYIARWCKKVIPYHGEVFDFDCNIDEYGSDSMFCCF